MVQHHPVFPPAKFNLPKTLMEGKKRASPIDQPAPLDQPEKKKIIAPPRRRAWYLEETPVHKVQGMYPGVIIMVETAQLRN